MRMFGVAVGEAQAQGLRDACLVAMRIERADAGIGARGGAADAGEAVHHQRRPSIPAAHEFQQIGDVLLVRHDVAVERSGNIVEPQPEMIFRRDAARPVDAVHVADQRHDVARTGVLDGFVQARERTDVNHGIKQ